MKSLVTFSHPFEAKWENIKSLVTFSNAQIKTWTCEKVVNKAFQNKKGNSTFPFFPYIS